MERIDVNDLIQIAAAAEASDAPPEQCEGAGAPSGDMAAGCLRMSRLHALAGGLAATHDEARHLAVCGVCAGRLRAFRVRAVPGRVGAQRWGARSWMRAGALGVAACLGWLLLRSAVSPVAPSAAPTAHAALPVTVRYAPMAASPGAARVDCFQSTPQEACVMMALFQTWNSACECLIWELHRWEDGAALASVRAGESVDVPLNVSDDPPVTQMFVVAVARERNAMPSDAEHLLDCLMRAAPGPGSPNDMAAYSSAVSGCLPEGVTVVPTSFVVK